MRNRKNYSSRIRKESRTILLYGDPDRGNGLDDGRYYRCWNCGFICNIDRDALGGQESRDGISYEAFTLDTDPSLNSISRLGGSFSPSTISPKERVGGTTERGTGFIGRLAIMSGNPSFITLAIGNTIDGIQLEPYYIKPVVNSGCPFCGSLNWKGDY